jgi:lipoprotein-releasing system permease protein
VTGIGPGQSAGFEAFCRTMPEIRSAEPFYEAQGLVVGADARQSAALVRAVPSDICSADAGFARELGMRNGRFDLSRPDSIVLGSGLAGTLGVHTGSFISLLALSGGSDVELLSDDRIFRVAGIFHTGYADINSGYAFVSLEAGQKYFGKQARLLYGLKLRNSSGDGTVIAAVKHAFPGLSVESWRSYNRSFFGALHVEKDMLMLLVCLIFVVVCINIFNGMRRLVYERQPEISILSAVGGRSRLIQSIFILRGFLTGIYGAVPGLAFGLLLSVQMNHVFSFTAQFLYWIQYFFTMLTAPAQAVYVRENPMYLLYARIPARIIPGEVLFITVSGILSALAASWLASRDVLKMTVAEVLHDE